MPAENLKVDDVNALKTKEEVYRISYDLLTGSSTYVNRVVSENNSSADVLVKRSVAMDVAEKIRKYIPNAHNISVQKKGIGNSSGNFGQVIFDTIFISREKDLGAFTLHDGEWSGFRQEPLTLFEVQTLGNTNEVFQVHYDLQTGDANFVERSVEQNNSLATEFFSFAKANEVANKIKEEIDNAINIEIKEQRVENDDANGNFGSEIFPAVFIAEKTDTSAWTNDEA